MSLLVISGISGAGKTLACDVLEDIGYYCIDNLPPALLLPVCNLNKNNKLAVVIDSRSKDEYRTLLTEIEKLKQQGIEHQLVFLYSEKDVILSRYKYTRRSHPLISEALPTLQMAMDEEYKLCEDVMENSDIVIDTLHLSAKQLRNVIIDSFSTTDYKGITIKLISFGYKNSLPSEADIVYDVRCMPNPFYVDELKQHSGLDKCVSDYVFSFEQSNKILELMEQYVRYCMPYFIIEGKSELVIAIGCTSGHHRSVSFAEALAKQLSDLNNKIVVVHRDINKDF